MDEPTPVRVRFKNKGAQGDDALGQMRLEFEDDDPNDPDTHDSWVMRTTAIEMADAVGVPFVETS